jgi:hypothetical protein
MGPEEFKVFIASVEGLCREEDCYALYSLVRSLNIEGDILDIGSFKGRVAVAFAKGLEDSGRTDTVYAFESGFFGSQAELLRNISRMKMEDSILPVFKHSSLASVNWRKRLKLVWVDTDGNFFSGKCDFLLWEPCLEKGGVIAFSCAKSPRIQKLLNNCVTASGRFTDIQRTGEIAYAYKLQERPALSGFNRMRVVILYFLHYNIRKIIYDLRRMFLPVPTGRETMVKRMINRIFERFL